MKKIAVIISSLCYVNIAFGYITEDMIGECDTTFDTMRAVFEPNEYTCANGYYLPADTLGCATCPAGATCNGGTFKFNATKPQGITHTAPITQNQAGLCSTRYETLLAKFQINEYNCSPGYYLPAGNDWLTNNDGCVPCLADSYCPGGTYTFNETVTQGINPCANGLHTPAGMWESDQCGRILHIGENVLYLRATKKTAHALHAKVGNDIFYGNMTTADVPMSATATQKLKVKLGDTIYSVYDDSINPGE